jgi:hypothetical protein
MVRSKNMHSTYVAYKGLKRDAKFKVSQNNDDDDDDKLQSTIRQQINTRKED